MERKIMFDLELETSEVNFLLRAIREPNVYQEMWCEMYDIIIERPGTPPFITPDKLRGCSQITIVRYVMDKLHERYLGKTTPPHTKSVLDATVENLAWKFTKDLVSAVFDKVDKCLEKE